MNIKQYEQMCLVVIVTITAVLLFLPKMFYRPGLILSSLFFIGMASIGLLLTWDRMLSKSQFPYLVYLIIPNCFIVFNLFYCFNIIRVNKQKIQDENVHMYYYKFMIITFCLFCLEFIFYYYLFKSLLLQHQAGANLNAMAIIFFSVLNYFVSRFNSIYFTHFSADG